MGATPPGNRAKWLTYAKDPFDLERFSQIRQIAAEILSSSDDPNTTGSVIDLFKRNFGYATPKVDVRAAANASNSGANSSTTLNFFSNHFPPLFPVNRRSSSNGNAGVRQAHPSVITPQIGLWNHFNSHKSPHSPPAITTPCEGRTAPHRHRRLTRDPSFL